MTVSRTPVTKPTSTSRGARVSVRDPVRPEALSSATRPATAATPRAEASTPMNSPSSSTARRSWEPVAPTQRSRASSRARWAVSTDRVLVTTSSATSTESPANRARKIASTSVPWDISWRASSANCSGVLMVRAGWPPWSVPRILLTSVVRESSCSWLREPSVRSRMPEPPASPGTSVAAMCPSPPGVAYQSGRLAEEFWDTIPLTVYCVVEPFSTPHSVSFTVSPTPRWRSSAVFSETATWVSEVGSSPVVSSAGSREGSPGRSPMTLGEFSFPPWAWTGAPCEAQALRTSGSSSILRIC